MTTETNHPSQEQLEEAFKVFEKERYPLAGTKHGDFIYSLPQNCIDEGEQGYVTYQVVIGHEPTNTFWRKKYIAHSEWGLDRETNFYQVIPKTIMVVDYTLSDPTDQNKEWME